MKRYARNLGTIGEDGQKILNNKKVLIVGAGGLGGFVLEGFSRMGVKTIGICDYDVFDETNLNRQLLSLENTIGKKKIDIAFRRIKDIDESINVILYDEKFPNAKVLKDISSYDIVIDCLDNLTTRIELEKICVDNNKKLIHGAVGGYYGTVGVISHKNKLIEKSVLNGIDDTHSVEKLMGNPFSIVGVVAMLQVHIGILVLLDRPYLEHGMYYIDIENFSIDEIVF